MSSIDTRPAPRSGDAGYKFVIRLKPSSTLAMEMAYRPSRVGSCSFPLPLVLASSFCAPPTAAAATAAATATALPQPKAPAAAAASKQSDDKGGSTTSSDTAVAASIVQDPLAINVEASGVQPLVVLSKSAVDFGACVVSRGVTQRPSPYLQELYVRNNTEGEIEVGGWVR